MRLLIDTYSETNFKVSEGLYNGNDTGCGQTVTGNGGVLNSAKFYLDKVGSPTGNAVYKIYAMSGVWGTSGVPTGAALAVSDNLDVTSLTTSKQLISLNFTGANKIILVNGTHYALSLEYSGGDTNNRIRAGLDNSSPTHPGNFFFFTAGTWSPDSASDGCFYLYVDNNLYRSLTCVGF